MTEFGLGVNRFLIEQMLFFFLSPWVEGTVIEGLKAEAGLFVHSLISPSRWQDWLL